MKDEPQKELQFHQERAGEHNAISGMSPEKTRSAALRISGGVEGAEDVKGGLR